MATHFRALIQELEQGQMKSELPQFAVGDTLKVQIKIIEGNKERLQAFQGTVISRNGRGLNETITLHRNMFGEGVERVLPLHSPRVATIEVLRKGRVRRAKLNYLRGTKGRKSKVAELVQ